MRTLITISILVLTITNGIGQTDVSKKGDTKKVEFKYESGELKEEGKEKLMLKVHSTSSGRANGVLIFFKQGKWTEYYKNGNKKRIVIYEKGEIVEVKKEWDKSGKRMKNKDYQN